MSGEALRIVQSRLAGAVSQHVAELIDRHGSEPFDAQAILLEHSYLREDRSAILELAYEEFCRRLQREKSVVADVFARRFPEVERSLLHQIQVHRYLEEHPELIAPPSNGEWPSPGDEFLGFGLRTEIGRGGFSRVFLAADRNLGDRSVVVKICEHGRAEAQILGRLQHPAIVPVHSAIRDDRTGLWAICMPDLGGVTLFSVLDMLYSTNARPVRASALLEATAGAAKREIETAPQRLYRNGSFVDGVLLVGLQIAEALEHAHAQGICHGDVKPSNILLTAAGQAMLLDFNLAFTTGAAKIGGTLPYMAPEQLRALVDARPDDDHPTDTRSDLFALGVVLFELLTGELPFGAIPLDRHTAAAAGVLLERQQRGSRCLQAMRPDAGRRVAQFIADLLAHAPLDRPRSAAEVARSLRRLLSLRGRMPRWARTHPLALSTLGGLSLMIVSAGWAATESMLSTAQFVTPQMHRLEVLIRRSEGLTAAGLRDLRRGHLQLAVEKFDQAVGSSPESLNARFWRGRARLLAGERPLARDDLRIVLERTGDSKVAACLAYCYSLDSFNSEAIRMYRAAIERGFAPAAVWNNLGRCHFLRGQFNEAEECLLTALECESRLAVALHNLGILYLRQAHAERGERRVELACRAAEMFEQALAYGEPSGELLQAAGWSYSLLARETSASDSDTCNAYVQKAIEAAECSLELGIDPRQLDVVRRNLPGGGKGLGFPEPRPGTTAPSRSQQEVLLMDPLAGEALNHDFDTEMAAAAAP